MVSREVFFTISGYEAPGNAVDDEAPDENKGKAADNAVDNKAPDKVIWETVGCTTVPTHL